MGAVRRDGVFTASAVLPVIPPLVVCSRMVLSPFTLWPGFNGSRFRGPACGDEPGPGGVCVRRQSPVSSCSHSEYGAPFVKLFFRLVQCLPTAFPACLSCAHACLLPPRFCWAFRRSQFIAPAFVEVVSVSDCLKGDCPFKFLIDVRRLSPGERRSSAVMRLPAR